MNALRTSPRKRIISMPNDLSSGGGQGQPKYIPPLIHFDPSSDSPTPSRRSSEQFEFVNGGVKEVSLGTLNVGLSLRRRRRMSSNAEQIQATQATEEEEPATYFHKKFAPIENFKKAVRLVQILITISEYGYKKKESDELTLPTYFTFTEYAAKEEEEQNTNELSFDVKFFKANKEMRLTTEIKEILTKPTNERTNQQLAKVQFSLRSIQSFAEYPVRMQKKLVRVGWYERHPTKRVILRQGHPPQAFYFVLSGSAVVKIVDRQRKVARTICFLKRGDSFGELAILHDAKRQSTVISRELIELLCISKEDFMDIFMAAGGVKNINDPDHAEFISSLEFLQGWPTEELPRNPKKCLFHFFRRGAVLVRDSNYSDWIYVVKSGSCQVLKKLKKVKSQIQQNSKNNDKNLRLEKLHDLAVKMARNKRDQLLDRHYTAIETVASVQESWNNFIEPPLSQVSVGRISNTANVTFAVEDDENCNGNKLNSGTDHGKFRSLGKYRSSGPVRRRASDRELDELKRNRDDIDLDAKKQELGRSRFATFGGPLPGGEQAALAAKRAYNLNMKRLKSSSMYIQTPSTSNTKRELESPQHKLAIIDEAAKKHEENAELSEADMNPCFVQVAVLQKGDVFGLHSIFCDGQPSLSLVSNGAECIMILKRFYMEHCSERMKGKLRKWVSPYPDDTELQSSLQNKVNWDHYRSQALDEAVRSTRLIRRIRDNSVI